MPLRIAVQEACWEETPLREDPMNPFHRAMKLAAFAAVSIALFVGLTAQASAQDVQSYPNKPVRIFVPYGAGGVGDLTMRLLAQKLSENAGQQFVIENRPGAGGALSARGALSAEPDGYSLAVTGNGQAISMTLFKARTYDVLGDFTQVSITATFEMLLAVKNDSPFATLPETDREWIFYKTAQALYPALAK